MPITPFRRTQSQQPEIRRLNDAVEASLRGVLEKRILDGNLIEDVELISGDTVIEHKLDRMLRGWIVVRRDGAADIYDKQMEAGLLTHRYLKLNSSAAVTVSLWVF